MKGDPTGHAWSFFFVLEMQGGFYVTGPRSSGFLALFKTHKKKAITSVARRDPFLSGEETIMRDGNADADAVVLAGDLSDTRYSTVLCSSRMG